MHKWNQIVLVPIALGCKILKPVLGIENHFWVGGNNVACFVCLIDDFTLGNSSN